MPNSDAPGYEIFGAESYGFRENLRLMKNRSLERKKFPVISSLEGRFATFPGDPLKESFSGIFWEGIMRC